jgi:uncharacterized Zn-binding protein involved in type VI secretion
MSKVARIGDTIKTGKTGSPDVFINNKAAARVGDTVSDQNYDRDSDHERDSDYHHVSIKTGSPNVFINSKTAARVGDTVSERDIKTGSPNVSAN